MWLDMPTKYEASEQEHDFHMVALKREPVFPHCAQCAASRESSSVSMYFLHIKTLQAFQIDPYMKITQFHNTKGNHLHYLPSLIITINYIQMYIVY